MISNYIKIALRALLRLKEYAAINLLGLSLGLTSALVLIYLDELSYDRFHSKADRIYRVVSI